MERPSYRPHLTATRMLWLRVLADAGGWVAWDAMPRRATSRAVQTVRTWRPLADAGLIDVNGVDFRITQAGRDALAEHGEGT